MPGLAELQAQFALALQEPEASSRINWVCENGISPARRIAVYRNNSRISQAEALAGIYPAVQQLVGEEFFERMADEYGAEFPSISGDLRQYGEHFAQFLSGFEPVIHLLYLPDVARLEWAWHACFHATSVDRSGCLDLSTLASVEADWVRLSLVPASCLFSSSYPVAGIWEYALDPEQQKERLNLEMLEEARLLIARPDERVDVMELTPAQFFWLSQINVGENLTAIFEQTLEHYPDFDFATNLSTFVRLGVVMLHTILP